MQKIDLTLRSFGDPPAGGTVEQPGRERSRPRGPLLRCATESPGLRCATLPELLISVMDFSPDCAQLMTTLEEPGKVAQFFRSPAQISMTEMKSCPKVAQDRKKSGSRGHESKGSSPSTKKGTAIWQCLKQYLWWRWWYSKPRPKTHPHNFLRVYLIYWDSPGQLPVSRPLSSVVPGS